MAEAADGVIRVGRMEFRNRTWESVSEGDELPPMTFGPLTDTTMMRAASGTRDSAKHHHDRAYAKENGAPDMFVNTMWYQALLGRYVTDWGGPESFLRRLDFRMRLHCVPGDTLTVRGTVTGKREENGQKLVDLDVRIDSTRNKDSVIASMTHELI